MEVLVQVQGVDYPAALECDINLRVVALQTFQLDVDANQGVSPPRDDSM